MVVLLVAYVVSCNHLSSPFALWYHVFLNLPLAVHPPIFIHARLLTHLLLFILSTFPNPPWFASMHELSNISIPIWYLSTSQDFLSHCVILHIYLTILISVRSNLPKSSAFAAQIPMPYRIPLLKHAANNLPCMCNEGSLDTSRGSNSVDFFHSLLILASFSSTFAT